MMAPAKLWRSRKFDLRGGFIVQIRIWQLPHPTTERPHGFKYSLFYGNENGRIVGYDNEAGKGDHQHYREKEEPYRFQSIAQLLADFWKDVRVEHG